MTNLAPLWCVIDTAFVLAALGAIHVGCRAVRAMRDLATEIRALRTPGAANTDLRPDEHAIVLNDYQIANLKAALEAAGYWTGPWDSRPPAVATHPNHTPSEMIESAKRRQHP